MIHYNSSFADLIPRAFCQTRAVAKSTKAAPYLPWPASLLSDAVFYNIAKASMFISLHIANNPNLSPIGKRFGLDWFGAGGRT